jgi:hypothetical protein
VSGLGSIQAAAVDTKAGMVAVMAMLEFWQETKASKSVGSEPSDDLRKMAMIRKFVVE